MTRMTGRQMNDFPPDAISPFGHYTPRPFVGRLINRAARCPATWFGVRRAFALRGVARKFLKGRPLDVERLGARMRLYPYNNVCEKRILFTPQYFDAEELEALRADIAAQTHSNYVFLDIGANIGGYTLFVAAHSGSQARIIAVEPQQDIFERLIFNVRQNDFAKVKALDCAVADADGEVTLFVDAQNKGETSIRIVNDNYGASQVRVPAKALKTIVREEGFTHVDAIKLDVEGVEDIILEAYFADAPRNVWPRLLIVADAPDRWSIDLPSYVLQAGYEQTMVTRTNLVFVRKDA
ncbi:FkbM family methyltransferase [Methylovirgula sp. 4M-Z18]|nr:FkbM family methyltransferase [Methylovirgula sp. 4M-Z18]